MDIYTPVRLPLSHLVHAPEDYQPLGSNKALRNRPSKHGYYNEYPIHDTRDPNYVDLKKSFMTPKNLGDIAFNIKEIGRDNGHDIPGPIVAKKVTKAAVRFIKHPIHSQLFTFRTVAVEATGQDNWSERFRTINNKFTQFCYGMINWNQFIPTRMHALVGPAHHKHLKPFHELTADEYKTLNVWKHQEIQITADRFRDNNRIPFYQHKMHTRHYDRSNEGFHATPDRSSLENPIYGYDMTSIEDTLGNWQREGWFGIGTKMTI